MISDLHRWIDLIHERGQAMYHAFNELRKHLEDIQRQIRELHRQNHDNQILVERLRKELEEWKEKCRKEQVSTPEHMADSLNERSCKLLMECQRQVIFHPSLLSSRSCKVFLVSSYCSMQPLTRVKYVGRTTFFAALNYYKLT